MLRMLRTIKNNQYIFGLIATVICCVLYASFISFKTMPISEGWYTEYAWQINHGQLPYVDFEYFFFPLYVYIIAGFTKIFGYSIIALRILGIIVFGGIGASFYVIFAKLFNNVAAMIAAVVSALYLQSEVGQVFYDYIRFHDLFALITVIFLVYVSDATYRQKPNRYNKFLDRAKFIIPALTGIICIVAACSSGMNYKFRTFAFVGIAIILILWAIAIKIWSNKFWLLHNTFSTKAFLCGVFVAGECMIKQSNGTLMIAFICVYFIFCAIAFRYKGFIVELVGAINGILITFSIMLVYLIGTNSLNDFVQCCFKSALSAKGGILAELFNWIPSSWYVFCTQINVLAIIIVIYEILYRRWVDSKNVTENKKKNNVIAINVILLLATIVINVFCVRVYGYNTSLNNTNIPVIVFFITTIVFFLLGITLLINYICKNSTDERLDILILAFPALGAAFAQGYGCAMSGGLATSQTSLAFGLVLGFGIYLAVENANFIFEVLLVFASLYLCSSFVACKSAQAYYWWGLTQDSISSHTETADVPLLEGIKMREMDKVCYETVYNDIIANTNDDDNIFVFPHCPIFYTISGRHSITYTKVQWFDVSSASAIESDIERLRINNPKIIVYVTVPDAAYDAHETLFNTYQTREMREFLLNELIPSGGYSLLHDVDLGNGFIVSTYVKE